MKRKIYIIIAVTGIFVAVSAVNDCNHEILVRFLGVVAFAVFSYMGGLWEAPRCGKAYRSRNDDDDPEKYPEE